MILVAFGTRPEIIKLFPVINELSVQKLPFKTLFSGQQLDLYEDVKSLIPTPDFNFAEIFSGNSRHNSLGESFIKICRASERLFTDNFDMVIVQGDTTTAWALAQMAFYNGVKVAHIEAGLRTFDLKNPYPEEINRTLITQIADINFAPTKQAYDNLVKCEARNIHLVGNTIVDAVNYFKDRLHLTSGNSSNQVLVTMHRRENHAVMDHLFDELQAVAVKYPQLEFIFPLHPNPNVMKHANRISAGNIRLASPMGYPELLKLMSQAAFIISDSGGIQEEATCFNKKVLIVREKTERPEVIDMGLGLLVGREIQNFISWAMNPPDPIEKSPYGNGDAARKIVQILSKSTEP